MAEWKNPYRERLRQELAREAGLLARGLPPLPEPEPEPLPEPRPGPGPEPSGEVLFRTPFSRDAIAAQRHNTFKESLETSIRELPFVDATVLRSVSPKVAGLTVKDLNDLAVEFAGMDARNENIADLTVQDIQDIEGIFFEFKAGAIGRFGGGELASVDVSCCCCTPCCCCAAADVDPF